MERCGMLQNITLLGELKKLEKAMHQAVKPTWGGPNDPDVLKSQLSEQEEFRPEVQSICEDGKHRTMHTQRQMCSFLDELRHKALEDKIQHSSEVACHG
jgi:hypothetical protein